MKLISVVIAIFFTSFISLQTNNPLRNTKWEDPNGLQVQFTASDTVKLLMDDKLITSAQYKVKDSFLTWRDFIVTPGNCDTSIRGTYVYNIKDSLLSFKIYSDRCEGRARVLQTLLLARQ